MDEESSIEEKGKMERKMLFIEWKKICFRRESLARQKSSVKWISFSDMSIRYFLKITN